MDLKDIKTATGKTIAAGDFDDLHVFVPEKRAIVSLSLGTGDNLSAEYNNVGLLDYINYTSWEMENDNLDEADGGEVDFNKYVQDLYPALVCAVPDILEDMYGDRTLEFIVLV